MSRPETRSKTGDFPDLKRAFLAEAIRIARRPQVQKARRAAHDNLARLVKSSSTFNAR